MSNREWFDVVYIGGQTLSKNDGTDRVLLPYSVGMGKVSNGPPEHWQSIRDEAIIFEDTNSDQFIVPRRDCIKFNEEYDGVSWMHRRFNNCVGVDVRIDYSALPIRVSFYLNEQVAPKVVVISPTPEQAYNLAISVLFRLTLPEPRWRMTLMFGA